MFVCTSLHTKTYRQFKVSSKMLQRGKGWQKATLTFTGPSGNYFTLTQT